MNDYSCVDTRELIIQNEYKTTDLIVHLPGGDTIETKYLLLFALDYISKHDFPQFEQPDQILEMEYYVSVILSFV